MNKKQMIIATSILIVLLGAAITALVITNTTNQPKQTITQPSPITATGTLACLNHKNATPGTPQTLECAIGLKTDDGRYYALEQLTNDQSATSFDKHIQVSGQAYPPSADTIYDTLGTIKVESFTVQ